MPVFFKKELNNETLSLLFGESTILKDIQERCMNGLDETRAIEALPDGSVYIDLALYYQWREEYYF